MTERLLGQRRIVGGEDLSEARIVVESRSAASSTVALEGHADLRTAPEFQAALAVALEDGPDELIVDLSPATFIDSSILGVLVRTAKRMRFAGARMVVVCPDPGIDAGHPILRQDRATKSAPLAAPLIASAALPRLRRSITTSSEEAGGAKRVGVGTGADVGGRWGVAARDRRSAGDQPAHGRPTRAQ